MFRIGRHRNRAACHACVSARCADRSADGSAGRSTDRSAHASACSAHAGGPRSDLCAARI